MTRRAIVTGATGFIGSNLARRLLHDGHEVHLLVRPGYRPWRIQSIAHEVKLHELDFTDRPALDRVIRAIRPDWVFHLAAYGAYSTQTDLHQMIQTNIIGSVNLVESCVEVGFQTFVNAGSSSEYGFKDHPPGEDEWLEPNSYYAVTKASTTMFCRYIAQSRQLPILTLRIYSAYGPFEEPTRLIPTLIDKGLQGQLPPLVNPNIARDFVYVDDVVDAFLLAATHPNPTGEWGAVYNVGMGKQTSLQDVVAVTQQVFDLQVEPEWGSMPDRQWDTSNWVAATEKIRRELAWQPHYTFEAGFRATLEWLIQHQNL